MKQYTCLFGLTLGLSIAFGGCDVEDVDGVGPRDAEIAALEDELISTQIALDEAEALVDAQDPVQSVDGDDADEEEAEIALPAGTYACCVPDDAEPPRGQCKKGSRFKTKDKCEGTEGGIFFSAENGQDGYQRCADECEGKIWAGNPVDAAPLE